MTDAPKIDTQAPERIGLIESPFGFALATRDEADMAIHYIRADLSDLSAALDRLIAERVREAVEAEREACAKVADELSTQWWSECKRVFDHHLEGKSDGADDIANAIRDRGSKEGRS